MNYLKLKDSIEKAIHARPLEIEPYNDLFDLCREYEKIDFAVAHEWNHALRTQAAFAMRSAVGQSKFEIAERFNDFLFRSLLFSAPHFFDDYLQAVEWGKPLDKKFYQPRRHYLKRYVDAYQEILEGKLDFLSISMPKRAGKSQLGINFTNMLSGKYPDRSTLMEGTGDDLVKSFYLGCLEYLQTPSDYHFYDIFPESKLVQTNADTKIINLLHKSRFPTVMCRSIDARQVGLSEATNLLYAGCDEYGQRSDFGFSHQVQGQTRKAEANAVVWRRIFAHGRPELASGWRKPVCGLRRPEHDFGALRGRFSFCISERSEHRDYERIGSSGFGDGERTGEVVVIEDSDLQSRYDAHRNHPPCFQSGLQANVQRPAYGEF